MKVIRAFIAVDFTENIYIHLEQVLHSLQQNIRPTNLVRWVKGRNIHLTLMFLGDVPVSDLGRVQDTLSRAVQEYGPFDIQLGGLGAFPSPRKPRVIWIGVEFPPVLKEIYHRVQLDIGGLGYPRDDRPFSPHLTVGRVSPKAAAAEIDNLSQVIQNTRVGVIGNATIDSVHLYRSDLGAGGAVYTRLFSTNLYALKQGL